jgi:hypothetical protein
MQIREQDLPVPQHLALHACGSFTFTIISAAAKTSAAVATTVAPAFRYVSSSMPMP